MGDEGYMGGAGGSGNMNGDVLGGYMMRADEDDDSDDSEDDEEEDDEGNGVSHQMGRPGISHGQGQGMGHHPHSSVRVDGHNDAHNMSSGGGHIL